MNADWARLFPESDYRPAMNLRVIDGRDYFRTRDATVLELRRDILRTHSDLHRCGEPDVSSLARYLGISAENLSAVIEPDWVLLRENAAGEFLVEGGCVCFPTMWSLPEKMGKPLGEVHAPVPGLNAALGAKIDQFLSRLDPATAYGRENWGLSATPQLDQHPRHGLLEIEPDAALDRIWLRIEEQALVRLDDRQIVFGIRIGNVRLDALPSPALAPRIAHALRSMPEEMATYKRLSGCRAAVAEKLDAASLH